MRSLAAISDELCQNATGRLRVDERDLEAEQSPARGLVHELDASGLQTLELRGHVVDLERHVVHSRAALGEEPADRGIGAEGLQELDPRLTDPQRGCLDALVLDPIAV